VIDQYCPGSIKNALSEGTPPDLPDLAFVSVGILPSLEI
jgi:hypothetical protein